MSLEQKYRGRGKGKEREEKDDRRMMRETTLKLTIPQKTQF